MEESKIYYIEGVIKETKLLKTKNGNDFVACKIIDIQNNLVEASCFDSDLLDKLQDLATFNFKLEQKGNYKNILELQEVDDSTTQTFLENISKFTNEKPKEYKQPTHDSDLYITLNGKTYVTQKGLLSEAHKKGLKSIVTEMIEFKDKELAVVKATITMKDGSIFTGYGDATKENVNFMIVKHILRMAETRSICRGLRLATNIGVTSIEELEN